LTLIDTLPGNCCSKQHQGEEDISKFKDAVERHEEELNRQLTEIEELSIGHVGLSPEKQHIAKRSEGLA
jgi:hypothetical protein